MRKLTGAPNNLGLDPFPDPVGHFWAPWRPFWISRPLIGQNTRSVQIKKLIYQKLTGASNNLGLDPFPDPVGHFGAHWQAVRRCRRRGVAGGERGPPAPLGWYSSLFLMLIPNFVNI